MEKTAKGMAYVFGNNVDTDQIYPGKYVEYTEMEEIRKYAMSGSEMPDFAKVFQPGDIIVGGTNFGCGSSREHAPWALDEYGFRTIIAPSFADIFFNNSFKNGLLPIVLKEEEVDALFDQAEATEGYQLTVDLQAQTVTRPDGVQYSFEIDAFRKHCLLNGLDDIGLTLQDADAIKAFEARHRASQPWLFGAIK